ncbi:pectate lyase F [Seiridium cupressi]
MMVISAIRSRLFFSALPSALSCPGVRGWSTDGDFDEDQFGRHCSSCWTTYDRGSGACADGEGDDCEKAITIKNDKAGQETWIIGGSAYHASGKIVQHNGFGTVNIIKFYAEDYGKVYRSCGNCSSQCKWNVYVEGTTAYDGGEVVGINSNYGDTATLKNVYTDAAHPYQMYTGCSNGCEPVKSGYCSG